MTDSTGRVARRVRFALEAEFTVDGETHEFHVRNVSVTGACLDSTKEFRVGAPCRVVIWLEGAEVAERCTLDGRVVRNNPGEVGMEFTEVIGLESFAHFKNLLLYNASDPEAIIQDLDERIGLKVVQNAPVHPEPKPITMRALIVDDSRAVRSIIKRSVTELGFQTFEAGNGVEALAQLEKIGAVEVALVDWNMPVMGGYELVQAVRANPAYAKMRIIMVTSESETTRMTEALAAGADEYLMKPFVVDALRDKLALTGLEVG